MNFLSQLKGCDVMRRTVATMLNAYRHGVQKHEDPAPSILGGLLSGGRGKPSTNLSRIKAQQELAFSSGLLTPVQQSHTSADNLIIRLFCADFNKGVHTWFVITAKSKLRSMVKIARAINATSATPVLKLS